MKLSIIVPIYNCEDKIKRLLKSVLSSDGDFEVICVNDGSTDGTLSVLESITDKRLVVFSKENQGTFKTWQFGLSKATGDYVTIFDQDDYIESSYIEYIFSFIENIKADLLFTPYYIEFENGTKKYENLPIDEGVYKDERLDEIRPILLSGRVPYAKFTKVIKREVLLDQVANTYQGAIRDFEDWLTMIQVFGKINSIYIANKPYYHYIQYTNANSVSKSTISYQKNYESLLAMIRFLTESTYIKLSDDNLDMIYFYASRIILNKCIKIKETTLANKILHDERFKHCIKKANIPRYEKILMSLGNANIYYQCYLVKKQIQNRFPFSRQKESRTLI